MTKLRVMTWNVLYEEQADKLLSLIRQYTPDILCCQEITTNSQTNPGRNVPLEVEQIIGGDYRYMTILPVLEGLPADMGNAVFSKFPIEGERKLMLTKGTNDITKGVQNRGYLEVKIDLGDKILTIGTTHLTYVDGFIETEQRNSEADKLLDFIKENNQRFMLMGDFNSSPNSTTIKKIEKTLKNLGPNTEQLTFTTKPFRHSEFRVDGLEWRLDYMFATPDIRVLSSEIIKTDVSDHLPILAEVEIS